MRKIKLEKAKNKIANFFVDKKFYYAASIILVVLFCGGLFLTRGDLLINFIHTTENATLTDFFVIFEAQPNAYSIGGTYPPLAYLSVIFLRHFMKLNISELTDLIGPKTHQSSLMIAIMCIILFVIFAAFICEELLCACKKEKFLFILLIFFSIPMLFEIERFNILFVAWIFLGLFFVWKDSSNAWLRELSFLCLAISAAIKIYPAIFGLLIVFEKRYKDAIRTIIYGMAFFFIPFLYFGGASKLIDNLVAIINNFTPNVDWLLDTHGNYNISYYAIGDFLLGKSNINFINFVQIILFLFAFSSLFMLHGYEKKVLALVCIIVGIPKVSFCYVAIFLIYPIIFFLNKTFEKKDIIYLLLLMLILYPLPIGYFQEYEDKRQYFWNNVSPFTLQQMISLVMLHILLFSDGIYTILKSKGLFNKKLKTLKTEKRMA